MKTKAVAAGGGSGLGIGVLVVWLAGYAGVDMTAEVGAIVGGLATGAGAAIYAQGLVNVLRRLLFGPPKE